MPGQSGPGSNGNEGVLHIYQSPSIIGTLPSDCLVSYPGHSLGESYHSVDVQSVYSTVLGERVKQERYKNATCCFEQILEAAPNKKAAAV